MEVQSIRGDKEGVGWTIVSPHDGGADGGE